MIKNAIIYRITAIPSYPAPVADLLAPNAFTPCAPSQEKSIGWAPTRGEVNDPLLENIGGQWILKAMTEVKTIPGDVIERKAKERITQIEAATGRKPGKKETREIKDDIKLELLPSAFPKQSSTLVWIDPVNMTLVVEATSQARADDVVTLLMKSLDGLALSLLNTSQTPAASMAVWLHDQESPPGFTVDRECELKAQDESKAVVKYGSHPLDIDEVKAHVAAGMMPTKLAMTWASRVSFVLTEGLQIKKLNFLDVAFESRVKAASEGVDGFDADVAILAGELSQLIPDLIEALGGEPAFTV